MIREKFISEDLDRSSFSQTGINKLIRMLEQSNFKRIDPGFSLTDEEIKDGCILLSSWSNDKWYIGFVKYPDGVFDLWQGPMPSDLTFGPNGFVRDWNVIELTEDRGFISVKE